MPLFISLYIFSFWPLVHSIMVNSHCVSLSNFSFGHLPLTILPFPPSAFRLPPSAFRLPPKIPRKDKLLKPLFKPLLLYQIYILSKFSPK